MHRTKTLTLVVYMTSVEQNKFYFNIIISHFPAIMMHNYMYIIHNNYIYYSKRIEKMEGYIVLGR